MAAKRRGRPWCAGAGPTTSCAHWRAPRCASWAPGTPFSFWLRNAYPINVLPAVRAIQEVCGIYCATANPVQVIVAETQQGRGILGVIDGFHTQGVESDEDIAARKALLRRFSYKAG